MRTAQRTVVRPFDFLLDGATGWRADPDPGRDGVTIDIDGRVTLAPMVLDPDAGRPRAVLLAHSVPRGMAVWQDHIFAADPDRHLIWHAGPCDDGPRPLPSIGPEGTEPRELDTPTGLTISHRGDLVVVERGGRRLQLFTLPELALRRVVGDPTGHDEGDGWRPIDVAAGPDGSLMVADRNGRIWKLDRQCRPDALFDGRLPPGWEPRRVAVGRDGRTHVAFANHERVLVLRRNGQIEEPADEAPYDPTSIAPARFVLGAGGTHDRFVIVAPEPTTCRTAPFPTVFQVDSAGRLIVDAADGEPGPMLRAPAPTPRFAPSGTLRIGPLDSGRVKNPWHRVALELDVPDRTSVQLFALVSDIERPDVAPPDPGAPAGPWEAAPANADEWLIQTPRGRFLHLALRLQSPGDRTPVVERVYVYAHRDSSLRYLPAAYHEDETSRQVLDRLLSLTDTVTAEIETVVEGFAGHLDAAATPPDFLPWLASWFDLAFEPSWNDATRRRLLASIVELYRWRGTTYGLEQLLRLVLGLEGPLPRVVERFRAGGRTDLERWFDDGGPPPDIPEHHVEIFLPASTLDRAEKRLAIERLVAAGVPAHVTFRLRAVAPGLRLGGPEHAGSVVGVDTLVGAPRPWRLPGDGELPNADDRLARLLSARCRTSFAPSFDTDLTGEARS